MADPIIHKKNILFSNLSTLYFDTKKKINYKKFSITRILTTIILISVAATFLLLPFIFHLLKDIKFDTLGVYGDFFGSFTSLFTVLAFGGLIISLCYQRRDLELQRHELKAQVKEMKDQADAQKEQAEYLAKQFRLMGAQFNLSKVQLQLSQKQAKLMDQQVKSMVEQTEKEMRPYLNVYIDWNEFSHALIIKNVGRTACTDFTMTAILKGNIPEEHKDFAESVIKKISDFHLDLIPAGMEYAVELDDFQKEEYLNSLYSKDTCLEIHFKFIGLGKKTDGFKVKFSLDEEKAPTRRSQFGSRDICKQLKELNEVIKGLKDDMASYIKMPRP